MESRLEKGDCKTCLQRRVLGLTVTCKRDGCTTPELEFRCCACLDEYGEGPVQVRKASDDILMGRTMSEEPPRRLEDVPAGLLERVHFRISGAGAVEDLVAVLDPMHNFFSGHGGQRVWPACAVLAKTLLRWPPGSHRVVELGAGTGLPSLVLARRGCQTVLTDVPWMMPLAEYNVQANFADDAPRRPWTLPLRWGSAPDAAAVRKALRGGPDLVIAADVVYKRCDFGPLLETLNALACPKVLLAVVDRDKVVASFLSALEQYGWKAEASPTAAGSSISRIDGMEVLVLRLAPLQPLSRRARGGRKAAQATGPEIASRRSRKARGTGGRRRVATPAAGVCAAGAETQWN